MVGPVEGVRRQADRAESRGDEAEPPRDGIGPLHGVTVLDMTQIELGPCATQVLGDFGANVIKIERPGAGDPLRFYMQGPHGESAVFWGLNRNKRSVAIDIRTPLGREAIRRLARRADVLVHNFRPGVMERLGFGPDDLRALNPRLISPSGPATGRMHTREELAELGFSAEEIAALVDGRAGERSPTA